VLSRVTEGLRGTIAAGLQAVAGPRSANMRPTTRASGADSADGAAARNELLQRAMFQSGRYL
jgi:hypothetical protein